MTEVEHPDEITSENCYLQQNYKGFEITHPSGMVAYQMVHTMSDCQALCQTLENCNFFKTHLNRYFETLYGLFSSW